MDNDVEILKGITQEHPYHDHIRTQDNSESIWEFVEHMDEFLIDKAIQVPVYCNFSLYKSMNTDAIKNVNGSLKGVVVKTEFPKVNGEDIDARYKCIKIYDIPKKLHKYMYETVSTGKNAYLTNVRTNAEDEEQLKKIDEYTKHNLYLFPRVGFLQDSTPKNIYSLSNTFTPIDWINVHKLKDVSERPEVSRYGDITYPASWWYEMWYPMERYNELPNKDTE